MKRPINDFNIPHSAVCYTEETLRLARGLLTNACKKSWPALFLLVPLWLAGHHWWAWGLTVTDVPMQLMGALAVGCVRLSMSPDVGEDDGRSGMS